MSWLELWEFVLALPLNSMTMSVRRGDHGLRRWTETEYLLRQQIDLLSAQYMALCKANFEGEPQKPDLWPMPDLRSPEEIESERDLAEARAERLRRFREATKPGATDAGYARRLEEARQEHLRRMAKDKHDN